MGVPAFENVNKVSCSFQFSAAPQVGSWNLAQKNLLEASVVQGIFAPIAV